MAPYRNEAKFIFVVFLWLGPIHSGLIAELMKFFKNELEREESRARINKDRSSQEDREREWARLKERRRKPKPTMPGSLEMPESQK